MFGWELHPLHHSSSPKILLMFPLGHLAKGKTVQHCPAFPFSHHSPTEGRSGWTSGKIPPLEEYLRTGTIPGSAQKPVNVAIPEWFSGQIGIYWALGLDIRALSDSMVIQASGRAVPESPSCFCPLRVCQTPTITTSSAGCWPG